MLASALIGIVLLAQPAAHPYTKVNFEVWNQSTYAGGLYRTNRHSAAVASAANRLLLVDTAFTFSETSRYGSQVTAEIWELSKPSRIIRAGIPDIQATGAAISENGKYIVVAGASGLSYRIQGSKLERLSSHTPSVDPATGDVSRMGVPIALSNDGKLLAFWDDATKDGFTVEVWKLPAWSRSSRVRYGSGAVNCASARFAEDGRSLLVGFAMETKTGGKSTDTEWIEYPTTSFIAGKSKIELDSSGKTVGNSQGVARGITAPRGDEYTGFSWIVDPDGIVYSVRSESKKWWLYRESSRLFSYGDRDTMPFLGFVTSKGRYITSGDMQLSVLRNRVGATGAHYSGEVLRVPEGK